MKGVAREEMKIQGEGGEWRCHGVNQGGTEGLKTKVEPEGRRDKAHPETKKTRVLGLEARSGSATEEGAEERFSGGRAEKLY